MCGIAGVVRPDGAPCETQLSAMVAALRHRGPDASRVVDVDGVAAFGHARLSIIDLSERATQPMTDASGRYTLTFNGEIYNFRELRESLLEKGHTFKTTSDTEVVVEAFAAWGVAAFERFNGMFALGVWDRYERELVLARDRFGEKPLYYGHLGRVFAFASELRALRVAPGFIEKPPSIAALNHYLALGYILGPLSAHPDVLKLPPATYLRVKPGAPPQLTRYWDYASCFRRRWLGSTNDAIERLRHHLDRAVSERLVADVPVGTFLSGGLDSSTLTAIAKRHLPYELHTFSAGFEQPSYDESSDARNVSKVLETIHHELSISRGDGPRMTREAIAAYDEPFSDTSLVPMVQVSALAARHVKVVLGGDGADEIFAGYATYRADRWARRVRWIPSPARAQIARLVVSHLRESRAKMNLGFRARQFARGMPHDYRRAHYSWRELHTVAERIALLGAEHSEEVRASDPFLSFAEHYAEVGGLDELSQHLYVDAKTWLVDDILVKLDRATMASSIEGRAPFLDGPLVEFVASLPPELKLAGSSEKVALRRVASSLVPASVLRKKKAGFNAPVHEWFASGENEHRLLNMKVAKHWLGEPWPAATGVGSA
ncbi:MAG: asparagine synthase (glutamine-hydrolyzing) [Myxococcota bacterium]